MTNPVLQALGFAQQRERDAEVEATVYAELGLPAESGATPDEFLAWCMSRGLSALPARPATVAFFVLRGPIAVEKLPAVLDAISGAHVAIGVADPVASWPVPAAVAKVMRLDPPKSWPKIEKRQFLELPHKLQRFWSAHETRREKEISRALSEAGAARQKLKAFEEQNDEIKIAS